MATLYPQDPDCSTDSERMVVDWIKADANSDDWEVIHSLLIADPKHGGRQAEVDFVVIAPHQGVFVLEVKGGAVFADENGGWHTKNLYGEDVPWGRGPNEQASDNMYHVVDYLREHWTEGIPDERIREDFDTIAFGWAMVFPNSSFRRASTSEFFDWQVADGNGMERRSFSAFIRTLAKHEKSRQRKTGLDRESAPKVRKLLRGCQSASFSYLSEIAFSQRRIEEYTFEQTAIIEAAIDNRRLLVVGPGGSGKSVIARAIALRCLREGKRTALLCFNLSLALESRRFMAEELAGYPGGSGLDGMSVDAIEELLSESSGIGCVSSFLTLLAKLVGDDVDSVNRRVEAMADQDRQRYFKEELPTSFLELADDAYEPFDVLVVDEFQDLLREEYLVCLDLLLKGELSRGRWLFIGDVEHQNIFGEHGLIGSADAGANAIEPALAGLYGHLGTQEESDGRERLTFLRLRLNCRNTKNINDALVGLCGAESVCRPDAHEGFRVFFREWRRAEDESQVLGKVLQQLKSKDVPADDIVILSWRRLENSNLSDLLKRNDLPYEISIASHGEPFGRRDTVVFSTIASFKGMESPVVILTGVGSYRDSESAWRNEGIIRNNYLGMSRAKAILYVLESSDARRQREAIERNER